MHVMPASPLSWELEILTLKATYEFSFKLPCMILVLVSMLRFETSYYTDHYLVVLLLSFTPLQLLTPSAPRNIAERLKHTLELEHTLLSGIRSRTLISYYYQSS